MANITKLYHYSANKYDALKTREAQGITDNNHGSSRDNYNKTMSLYLEPAPLDILGTIYKKGYNDFWYTGHRIYQYEVLIKDMPKFSYNIVESPEKTDLYYKWWFEDEKPDSTYQEFRDKVDILEKKLGYKGDTKEQFIEAASKLFGRGLTRKYYELLPTRPNWPKDEYDNIASKYAACVPHVMLEPEGGIVHYHNVKEVVVDNKPLSVRPSLETIYTRWN
jgi:hypothetical protein